MNDLMCEAMLKEMIKLDFIYGVRTIQHLFSFPLFLFYLTSSFITLHFQLFKCLVQHPSTNLSTFIMHPRNAPHPRLTLIHMMMVALSFHRITLIDLRVLGDLMLVLVTVLGVPHHLQCWQEYYWTAMATWKCSQTRPGVLPLDLASAQVPGSPLWTSPSTWSILQDHAYRDWIQQQIPAVLRTMDTFQTAVNELWYPGNHNQTDLVVLRSLQDASIQLRNLDLLLSAWPRTNKPQLSPPLDEMTQQA